MIRSYHSAADWPRLKRRLDEGDGHDSLVLAAWSTFWAQWASASCIAGYRSATEGAAFLPSTDLAWSVLLKSLLVAKACYEVRYELGSRPEWVGIPIAGLRALIGDGPDSDI
jgi:maltose alpha-D-glucosyltransferase/alpha-amylase